MTDPCIYITNSFQVWTLRPDVVTAARLFANVSSLTVFAYQGKSKLSGDGSLEPRRSKSYERYDNAKIYGETTGATQEGHRREAGDT